MNGLNLISGENQVSGDWGRKELFLYANVIAYVLFLSVQVSDQRFVRHGNKLKYNSSTADSFACNRILF